MLKVCEVYSNGVKSSYESNGDSIDIINFRWKGNEINEVPFQTGYNISFNVTQTNFDRF